MIILKALTALIHKGKSPTPAEVLKRAQDMEAKVFDKWNPHKISCVLRQFSITSQRSSKMRIFNVSLDYLRMLERNYGIDLNTENRPIHIAICGSYL